MAQQKILIVDDSPANIKILVEALRSDYQIMVATNGQEALDIAFSRKVPDLILLDIMMPGMDGYEVCRQLKAEPHTHNIPVIFVSALGEWEDEIKGLELDAIDYIVKPFAINTVKVRIHNHLELKRHRDHLDELVRERTSALQIANRKLERILEQTVNVLRLAVEIRDPYTAGHQHRVMLLACKIAEHLGMESSQIDSIRIAALLHDIGKIAIPSEILSKPGSLSHNEFNFLKEHPTTGYEILKEVEFPLPVAQFVVQHHEKMDGSGYPEGLMGQEIRPESRIICVADVVEAMYAHRPYRPSLGLDAALNEIKSKKGKLYDPEVVDVCLNLFKEQIFTF